MEWWNEKHSRSYLAKAKIGSESRAPRGPLGFRIYDERASPRYHEASSLLSKKPLLPF